jgi:hypothetical protein
MCYSKEVQLITATIIIISALIYYFYFTNKYKNSKKEWLLPFLNFSTLVFLCIGLHQFFEFLSLVTINQLVYKTGLMISICATYFLLKSLESLSNKKIGSWIAIILIIFIGFQVFTTSMDFTDSSFFLRHNSAFYWATAWFFLYIYLHVCAFKIYSEIKDDKSKKTILLYLLTIGDLSFIISMIYVFVGYIFFSVNVCTDSPSIWCTFFVLQSFLIPILFFRLGKSFHKKSKPTKLTRMQIITYLAISLIILLILGSTMPLFNCLTWKFIFP